MFRFIKQVFVALLSFNGSLDTKWISLNNEPCLTRPTLVYLNFDEDDHGLHHFLFIMESCNILGDLLSRICTPD